ncbi:transmembrane protein, putative [Medicago truncatula]|uniref:Transmembrane protein, putative n=1 Tax=Medicago truncatula TaxID=3880 RepID=A0A072TKT5_MEDTR|nr:transmembrane protein, putative [Medicago truncatula]
MPLTPPPKKKLGLGSLQRNRQTEDTRRYFEIVRLINLIFMTLFLAWGIKHRNKEAVSILFSQIWEITQFPFLLSHRFQIHQRWATDPARADMRTGQALFPLGIEPGTSLEEAPCHYDNHRKNLALRKYKHKICDEYRANI